MRKAVIAIAAGALVCGAWGTAALAKTHHKKQHAAQTTAAAPQQAPTMPGNNPIVNPKASPAVQNAQQPSAIGGNNPMKLK